MNIQDAIKRRHSVRSYSPTKISSKDEAKLKTLIAQSNKVSGLHLQLITQDPKAFSGFKARYGNFDNVRNYIALVGPKGGDTEEKIGYYGEELVLKAQMLGLNTCWVMLTYSKNKDRVEIGPNEKLYGVIAIGYGTTNGSSRKSKTPQEVADNLEDAPAWYLKGIEAALMAPTAVNQQKFHFSREGDVVDAKVAGTGFYTKADLGIVKKNFELGAGKDNFSWK